MSVLLFDRVKMGIRLSRRNKIKGTGCKNILLMTIGLLVAHLRTEFIYYKMVPYLDEFTVIWGAGDALHEVANETLKY